MLDNLTDKLRLNNRIPVVYQYIYKKIVERDGWCLRNVPVEVTKIDKKTIKFFLSRCMVPIEIQHTFLQELEQYGLIINGKKKIEIIRK